MKKKIETEKLLECISKLASDGVISITKSLKKQLLSEATKNRNFSKSNFIDTELYEAAKSLKENEDVMVPKPTSRIALL